jgi:hypothetical protein
MTSTVNKIKAKAANPNNQSVINFLNEENF